tara:strand:+ start:124 stop:555 length:432 start_codon:yes stop_codon:yes gene_type:complete
MKKEKKEIEESLNEIRKVMEEDPKKDNKILDNNSDVLLLKKIVSKSNVQYEKDEKFSKNKLTEKNTLKNTVTNVHAKKKNTKKIRPQKNSKRKNSDPIALMVEKEIKPIIKKWINKNLRSFVKTIVVEEMKLISDATQKRTIK